MSGRRLVPLAGVALALLAAVALVLLARGVSDVERRLEEPPLAASPITTDERSVEERVAESLLGAGDDRLLQEALRLIEASRAPDLVPSTVLAQHGEAISRLTQLMDEGDPARRSYAANLVGALYVLDSALDPGGRDRYLDLAIEVFQEAVLLDPGNEQAKRNLELVFSGGGDASGQAGEESLGSSGGVGSRPPGTGY